MDQIVRKLEEAPPTPGTPDAQGRRTITLQIEAETLDGQLKRAVISGGSTSPFEAYCDEGTYLGGGDSAPSPLAFFSLGIAFWMLTQFARLSEQLKLTYTKARVSQTTHFIRGGTVIENDIYGEPGELVTNIDVDSDEPADKVARVVKLAEQSCFAIQSMMGTTPVSATATLKGEALAY